MPPHASSLPASTASLTRSQVLGFTALLILPLLLLATLPWQPFLTGSLQSGWLWWSYALTRMVDIPGIGISGALLLMLTRYKIKLELAPFIALGCALAALLASDWVLKSLI
ncbi:TPA: phosphatase PAP2 family protein, partial [Aeromonas veronii]